MSIKSYSSKEVDTIKTFLEQDLRDGFNPTLAICFCAHNLDFRTLSSYLVSKNIDFFGATTCGEIYDNTIVEGTYSILLIELEKNAYHIEMASFEEIEEDAAKKIAKVALEKFTKPAILTYASKVGVNGDSIVRGYKKILDVKTPIFGGLAGDDFRNEEFTVFHNETFETNGLAALIFDGTKVKIGGKAFSGWEALGKTHIVTKAEGNTLYELDNTPALELFIEYFGLEKSDQTEGEKMELIPGIYALKVIDKYDTEKIRSPLYYDHESHSLILAGELEIGDKVKFCPMPDIDIVTNTVEFFEEYSESHKEVDAIIITSCAARKFAFGPLMKKEINDVYEIWNAPTIGIIAMGEIGSHTIESECNFHNVTCSLFSLTLANKAKI
jgi:hypothetical protein